MMQRKSISLRQRIRLSSSKDGFCYRVSLLAGGSALSQALVVAVAPLLTRIFSAHDFGILHVYISILGFGYVIAAGRYELAILLPSDDRDAASLVIAALIVVMLTTTCYTIFLFLFAEFKLIPTSLAGIIPYLWLAPCSLSAAGFYLVLSHWALRHQAVAEVATSKLAQAVAQTGVQLSCGAGFGMGVLGLLLGEAIGRASGLIPVARMLLRKSQCAFQQVTAHTIVTTAKEYRTFPLIAGPAALFNVAGSSIPALLLGFGLGPVVLGWFALVERLLGVPSIILGQGVSQAYMAEAAPLVARHSTGLRKLFKRRLLQLALLGAPPFAAIFLLAPSIVSIVFGDSWREAGYYARILAPTTYVSFVVWPLMPTLNLLERQKWQLWWDVARLLTTAGLITATMKTSTAGRDAVLAYGIAMLLGYVAHGFLSYYAIVLAEQSDQRNHSPQP